ncbi:tail assembly protein [Stenotrophomonas phage vB_SmaS_DLP_5]|uniref:Tail assembly protein n=1 Tax=Stenotrophomonas phage vB_SmaS_DLP_5 TaxID=2044561 RepID=A0A2D2W2T7_9CAUD|nr:tail assembly protein [Stenotrophomonas phage vB_SmaS_DLP_5]ATS92296.1 tail assembly protein [Stenotrophomonas phage vB_SmaS_DLP_5]
MTVRFYQSSDVDAPVLRGNTPGDMINLLEKCLVTGYGSGPNAKVGAGWTKPFAGTNVACFKQGAGSNGMYLRVDDTSTATSYRKAKVVGYENMVDVNTGSPISFPTPAQNPNQGNWFTYYSSGSLANPRIWQIIADEKFFWFFIKTWPEDGYGTYYNECYAFGDIIPFKPGDTTHTILLQNDNPDSPNSSETYPFEGVSISSVLTKYRISVARSFTNLGGPITCGWHSDMTKGSSNWGRGNLAYPHGPDGGLYLSPVWLHEPHVSPYNVRGIMPGLWIPCHVAGILSQNQIFDGQGDLAGRKFFAKRHYENTACFEISDTWDR